MRIQVAALLAALLLALLASTAVASRDTLAMRAVMSRVVDAMASNQPLQFDELSEEEQTQLLQLEEHLQTLTEAEVRGYVDDVVNKVKDKAKSWISEVQTSLSNSVSSIKDKAKTKLDSFVDGMVNDVTSYVRTKVVAPFQNFAGKLDGAKTEVQTAINTVYNDAAGVVNTIETAVVALAKRLMNPFGIPDTVQCTAPAFLTANGGGADASQTWCKIAWVSDKFGASGFFGKVGERLQTMYNKIKPSGAAFVEVEDGQIAAVAAANAAQNGGYDCNNARAVGAFVNGLDTCLNILLSAMDTESAVQWQLFKLSAVLKVGVPFVAACAAQGSW